MRHRDQLTCLPTTSWSNTCPWKIAFLRSLTVHNAHIITQLATQSKVGQTAAVHRFRRIALVERTFDCCVYSLFWRLPPSMLVLTLSHRSPSDGECGMPGAWCSPGDGGSLNISLQLWPPGDSGLP